MRKKLIILTVLSVITFLVKAHEFWLEPDRFYNNAGSSAVIRFRIGADFIGEDRELTNDRIVRFESHTAQGVSNLRQNLRADTTGLFQVALESEGTHLIAMETSPAFIELDGAKFTEYLQEDGLDEILYQRRKDEISGDSASEMYSRHTKLILQAGTKTDDTFKKICGLPLEIIPTKNPATLKKGDPIAFKILFQGKPLFGAKVKVWNRHNHRTSVQNIFSQQDGTIETHVSNPGVWMVSVVKMIPSPDPQAQYRSYWSTVVFGIR